MAGIVSTCLVTMANPSISRLALTPWDLQFLLLDPIQKGLFFYKPPNQINIIQHLKTSLSKTLDFFPPLAGRLATTNNETNDSSYYHVECNNAGAIFTHAIANGVYISDMIDSLYVPSIVTSFFPMNGVSNCQGVSNPLLGVQVTELADGFFVACTLNHCVADGTSFWHFFNSWSEISRGAKNISTLPVFERSFNEFPPNVPIPIPHSEFIPSEKEFNPGELVARVFTFGKENLSKLKAKANSEAGTDKISSLQALMAHFWRAIIRGRGFSQVEEVAFLYAIGARKRVPLPETYFGNAIHIAIVKTDSEKLENNGFGWVALEMNKIVGLQTKEEVKRQFKHLMENFSLPGKNRVLMNDNVVVISSSPRDNVYGVDFGWGKPVATRSGQNNRFDGKVMVNPSAEDGGIDVEACLSPERMVAIENDVEFMEGYN